MRSSQLACIMMLCLFPTAGSLAQDHHAPQGAHDQAHESKPVNAMCPIGEEAIDPSAGTIEYKGDTIGFCCPGCSEKFMAWDEAKRDAFVVHAKLAHPSDAHHAPDTDHDIDSGKDAKAPAWSGPYPLSTCPVSGEDLHEDGDPIVKVYEGREIKFCCRRCVGKFEKDQDKYLALIDEQIIEDQMAYYPLTTCVVSSEPLVEDGEDIAVNMVSGNRLVRLCCKVCKKKFAADPAKFMAMLDKAAADAQHKDYPLTTCIVSGEDLGEDGEPIETVVAGRLVRLCCKKCVAKLQADPAEYIEKLDTAWEASHTKIDG